MTTAKNDITGDSIASKKTNDAFREGYDRIFGNKGGDTPEPKKDERISWPFPTLPSVDQDQQ